MHQFLPLLLFSVNASIHSAHDLTMPRSCLILLSFLSARISLHLPPVPLSAWHPVSLYTHSLEGHHVLYFP